MTPLEELHVVVPARDERELLPRCLDALGVAALSLAQLRDAPRVTVTVVLDRCTDGTAEVVRDHPVRVMTTDVGNVGAARRLGVASILASTAGLSPRRVWVASTDADSVAPERWLRDHVAAAAAGAQVVTGPVLPDPGDLGAQLLDRWLALHGPDAAARVVHGANLGFRLDSYLAVGGFRTLPEHEDVVLVSALVAAGARRGAVPTVLTSGRRQGRTPGGFAGYLRRLADEPTGA
ncbi:glycosyltransferase [Nocardioides lijunqiniae]|uniref:glycosyltransferase n=1 Tax=Nocardioides lijunqiniae TaxID=2760832 RepID=UPI0018775AFB